MFALYELPVEATCHIYMSLPVAVSLNTPFSSVTVALKIAKVFDVPVEEIFVYEEEEN